MRAHSVWVMVILVHILILLSTPVAYSAETISRSDSPPPYALNRADEEYRYLNNPANRSDLWDPLKYVPLDAGGSWYLSLGGEARERYEYFSNPNWGRASRDSGYFLQRYFLHGDVHLGEAVRVFVQLQSSLENGRAGGPRPSDKDELDVHQAFLDLKLNMQESTSLTLRSGRQELAYGSQRIISVREGPNVRQSFDGFRAMYRSEDIQIDGFATKPSETRRYVFDDGPDQNKALWGVYSVLPAPLLEKGNIDLYYIGLYRNKAVFDQGAARETRHSVGTRLWRTAKQFDYNFEFIYQWGSFGNGTIQAWTAASDTGYTFGTLPLLPRLSLKADIASGDKDPHNRDLQTFNPLFPKGAYFSEDNLVGPANFMDLNPTVELHMSNHLKFIADWDFFWRENKHDGIYNSAVTLVRSGKNSNALYIGSQAQGQLEWCIDRHLSFTGIYAHFFAGPFIKETGTGKDVDYISTWMSYKF